MEILFETPRLFLRRFTREDAPLVYQLNRDPEVVRYVHEPVLENLEQASRLLEDIILPQYILNLGRWAVHKKNDGAFIGWCGVKYLPGKDEYDLGYRLLRSEWHQGYMTESARYTVLYAFQTLLLPVITAKAHIGNAASIRVLEKIGMQFTGTETVEGFTVRVYVLQAADVLNIC